MRDRRPFRQQKQNQTINLNERARGWVIALCGFRSHQHTFSSGWASVVHFLKTRKLSSGWLFKDEVKQWDTCQDPHRVALGWLFDRIRFLAGRVESSSPFVQHDEFLDVLLQPFREFSFWSDRKAERHVKERSRSDFPWRFSDGKAKTNGPSEGEICQHGVTQLAEREGKSAERLGISSDEGQCDHAGIRRFGRITL